MPVAQGLVQAIARSTGARRGQLEEQLDQIPCQPHDRVVAAGLRKLLLDRCDFAVEPGPEPAEVRQGVFVAAAQQRRNLGLRETFDPEAIWASVAAEHGVDTEQLRARLFADLRSNERLVQFDAVSPEALLQRYDVALAQAVLLRATCVTVTLTREQPQRVRQLFRAARFHGLLYRVRDSDEQSTVIELDGPLSLFSAVQRYGLKLAVFLLAVLRCQHWQLRAELRWGRAREAAVFELGPEQGLVAHGRAVSGISPAVSEFCDRFAQLTSAWTVAQNDRVFALPGQPVCVPDLVFTQQATGEEIYLEVFGFWSRDAVWQRIESLAQDFPARLILAVGKQLRVSEQVLDDTEAAELYVYRSTMSPRAVLRRLEQLVEQA